jgi:hypothetical protein
MFQSNTLQEIRNPAVLYVDCQSMQIIYECPSAEYKNPEIPIEMKGVGNEVKVKAKDRKKKTALAALAHRV